MPFSILEKGICAICVCDFINEVLPVDIEPARQYRHAIE